MNPPAIRFMYVGNLEPYQGIDLLLASFAIHHRAHPQDRLIIIGGAPADVTAYRAKAESAGLGGAVEFRGAQPVARMRAFFEEADVLVSPRIKGANTPMKIYSYLDSGKPVVATALSTHTQVLTPDAAALAAPEPEAFARELGRLAGDAGLRAQLAARGRELVRTTYSQAAFAQSLDTLYARAAARLHADRHPGAGCAAQPALRAMGSLESATFDLLVIGGGIHGAALARGAARRGMRVALVEQGDFGHAASANSLKVIHGGLRYLQHLDFRRMRESIRARSALLRLAPHLVRPRAFLMPTFGAGLRSRGALAAALAANALVSADRNRGLPPGRRLPAGGLLSAAACRALLPGLAAEGLTGGAVWHDAFAEDTERVTWELVRAAREAGAAVVNHARATSLLRADGRVTGALVTDLLTGQAHAVRAATTVFAGGPWLGALAPELAGAGGLPPGWVRAYNLVVRRPWVSALGTALEGTVELRDSAAVVRRSRRNLFLVPWRGGTLVGTWYAPWDGAPDACGLTPAEIAGAVGEINAVYPALALKPEEVGMTHVGLLPAHAAGSGEPDKTVRLLDATGGAPPGLIVLQGVKYTTGIVLGERLAQRLAGGRRAAREPAVAVVAADDVRERARAHGADLSPVVAERLAGRYGPRFCQVLDLALTVPDGLAPLAAGVDVLRAEVVYAVRCELACRLADVVLRRTDLGTLAAPARGTLEACAALMAAELGWDELRTAAEVADVIAFYRRRGVESRTARTSVSGG